MFTFYRATSGNFSCSLFKLDAILQLLYTPTLHIMICRDININSLVENEKRNQQDSLLLSYNLTNIVSFPVRVLNTSGTAIDNIFIDISQLESYTVTPVFNGLCDNDAQLLMITTDYSHMPIHHHHHVR